ncbi:FG-GAP-like repeat-containing protein [Arthrobacter sp. Z1-9]
MASAFTIFAIAAGALLWNPPASSAEVYSVSGVLVDSNGEPIAGAFAGISGDVLDPDSLTDSEGRFSIPVGGTSPVLAFAYAAPKAEPQITIETNNLEISGSTNIGTVKLPPLIPAVIRVVDSNGRPVAGATVSNDHYIDMSPNEWIDAGTGLNERLIASHGFWRPRSTTNAAGEAHLRTPRLASGLPNLFIHYKDPDTGITLTTTIPQGADPNTTTTAKLPPVSSVSGVLVDSNGEPIAGAFAGISGDVLDPDSLTDSEGRFSIPVGGTSPVLAFAYAAPKAEPQVTIETNNLEISGSTNIGTVKLPPLIPAVIRVVDSNGRPVAGATVSNDHYIDMSPNEWIDAGTGLNERLIASHGFWRPRSTTNAAGEAHLRTPRLASGLPNLFIHYKDPDTGITLTTTIPQGADPNTTTTAKLPPVSSVSGVLVDSNGEPIAGAFAGISGDVLDPDSLTDSEGRFSIPVGGTSPVLAFAYAAPKAEPQITIETNNLEISGSTNIGTVKLPPLIPAVIRVVDSNGRPVAGATVSNDHYIDMSPNEWIDAGTGLNERLIASHGFWRPRSTTNAAGEAHLRTPRLASGLPNLFIHYKDPDTGITLTTTIPQGADPNTTTTAKLIALAQRISVTPAPVIFIDNDGTAEDTYTIPVTDGVEYQIDGKTIAAGTYPGTGTITVTAKAKADYVLTGTIEWATTFKATPHQVTPAPVVFTDQDGTAEDTYIIPATEGVDYLVNRSVVAAGTHVATGTITVTAKAKTDYVLTGTTEWTVTFKATPYQVTPAAVVFTDRDGMSQDTYTVPATDGVEYQIDGKTIAAGTYPGTGTITVTAKAKADYILTGTTEWVTTFKATPHQVTSAPVVFTDNDGTTQDSYTIPAADGVDYQVNGETKAAGTYPATGTVTVTAKAKTDYVLTGTTEWNVTFKATPYQATPAPVVFSDKDGTAEDTYTIPAADGVDYQVNGETKAAGTYPATGTVTVTAKAKTDYVLTGTTEWTVTFKATPYQATPAPVVFSDKDGTAEDTYTIPATDGVDYQINGKTIEAGTYPGTGTITATAKAKTDYVLTGTTEWTTTFKTTPHQASPAPVVFNDLDGTSQDSYTIPATNGVDYLINIAVVSAGTHAATGTVTVTAKAKTDYVLTGTTEWTTTFKATPYQATPAAVVFTDNDGTAEDTYTIPATDGVDYQIGGKTIEAGTYPGTGTVIVTAKAKTDYVLAGTTEWAATFKATPYQATPAAVVFTDNDGTNQDTYTIPTTDGVDYLVNGSVVAAGTRAATGTITVTAKAKTDYVLTGTTEWTTTFKATPHQVTPAPVVFTDNDGTAEDTYTIPANDGVDYEVGGKTIEAGTYPGTGTITVTAKAKTDYILTGTTEWTTTFKATPYQVTPAPVVFTDKDGTAEDAYTIPATNGVDYLINNTVVAVGTYPGTGTITVTAKAKTDYVLTGTTEWVATFKATPYTAKRLNDFTGDGKTDLIARDGSGQLWLYPGTGTGDWSKRIDLGGGWDVMSTIVSAGDFNGDGKADVIARDTNGELWLYPGTGTGDWSRRQNMGGGWNVMTSIVAPGDFNGDGLLDLIARDSSGELWLYRNDGAGDWLKRVDLGAGWNIMSSIIAPGDFNSDGSVDLIARDTSGRLWLYPGNGQNEWLKRVDLGAGWNTMTAIIAPGDMNGDGRPDVIARDTSGELWLYPNNGSGDWYKRIDLGPGWTPMTAIL